MAWDKTLPAESSLMASADIRDNMEELDRLMRSGSSTTNGEDGQTITFAIVLQDTNYAVDIEFTADTGGLAGEVWISNKATNGFVVYNTGDINIAFNWATRPMI